MIDKGTLSTIGIGGWGLGGLAQSDPNNDDEKQISAVVYSLQKGCNFMEINLWNSQGYSVDILSEAIKRSGVARDKLFLIDVIYGYDYSSFIEVEKEFERVLEQFDTRSIDSLQFSMVTLEKFGYERVVGLVKRYLNEGIIRYTSLTNSNLEYLKRYYDTFRDRLFSHEVCFNFEIRANETLGIVDFAKERDILNIIYQPLRRNRTASCGWSLLVDLAKKYGRTQNQIILNWLSSREFHFLIKSDNISHINENLDALEFKMKEDDLVGMDKFRVPGYQLPVIDWFKTGVGTKIDQLPNVFDELYPRNE